MYFKSMEMRGFKSFVDATKMEFEPGITAIVGPNGCGKSNIADGIRWVLGEQSAKQMRGAKMEDFIFNGSAARKQTGFAEVSITIANVNGVITTQPYAEYEEITVTRKLYRTGESEYSINKVSCRLKDIIDIFLDTGVSTRSFSIIEQDQVTRIVNSKPDDRRYIIEEAAGVMKYKHRRNAALNKLTSSQQNLLRIQDILGELERQRNSLKRQANKAERYKTFRNEIREKGLIHFANEYQTLRASQKEAEARLGLMREAEAKLSASLATRRNQIVTLSNRIAAEEKRAGAFREERQSVLATIERNDHHRDLLSEQLRDLGENNQTALRDIASLEAEIASLRDEKEKKGAEIARLEETLAHTQGERTALNDECHALRERLAEKESEANSASAHLMQAMQDTAARENRLSSLTAKIEAVDKRIEEMEVREREAAIALREAEERLARIRNERQGSADEVAVERERNEHVKQSLIGLQSELREAEEGLKFSEDELTLLTSRLESLAELDRNMAGFGEGVRNLMKLREEGAEEAGAVQGLLADRLGVPAEYEKALSALLGDALQAVIVNDPADVVKSVDLLRSRDAGSASFLAGGVEPQRDEAGMIEHPALVGRAIDLITLTAAPAAARSLLAGAYVARDLAGGMDLWRMAGGACAVATLDGDLIEPTGLVTGGATGGGSGASIVARKRSVEELTAKVAIATAGRDDAKGRKEGLATRVSAEQEKLTHSDEALRALEMRQRELQQEAQREESERERVVAQQGRLVEERGRHNQERDVLAEEERGLTAELSQSASQKEEMERAVQSAREAIGASRVSFEETQSRLGALDLALAEQRGATESARRDLARMGESERGLHERVERLKNSIADFGRKKEEMEHSIESLQTENILFIKKKGALTSQLTTITEELNELIAQRTTAESGIHDDGKQLEDERKTLADLGVRKSEIDLRLENSLEKADHEFNLPLEDLENCDVSEHDLEEVARRLQFLRGELGRIGDVNMSALEEFEDVERRFTHMKEQHADLVSSIANLRKTIDGINATTSKLFQATFEEVAANFTTVFKRLFEGGRAEMRLVQEEGKEEPGVEILVQPPGKRVQNMTLLSAGEKAMTAIALLFAVFLKQPSPFCLLDEIDAPLDEANIFRFRDMLRELQDRTQFIIITHNQKTMSFADRLYGVTQQEEGVSTILGVDLHDHRHDDYSVSAA